MQASLEQQIKALHAEIQELLARLEGMERWKLNHTREHVEGADEG